MVPQKTRENDASSGFSVDQTWTRVADSGDVVAAGANATQWDGDRLRALAEVYLRAVAVGAPANEMAETLARAVLASDLVRLAQAVLDATEFRTARATELAPNPAIALVRWVAIGSIWRVQQQFLHAIRFVFQLNGNERRRLLLKRTRTLIDAA